MLEKARKVKEGKRNQGNLRKVKEIKEKEWKIKES